MTDTPMTRPDTHFSWNYRLVQLLLPPRLRGSLPSAPVRPRGSRFSPRMLLTPQDCTALAAWREAGPTLAWPARLPLSRAGRRFLGRVTLSAAGWLLGRPLRLLARRIQRARSPLSPLAWLREFLRLLYKLARRGRPLSEAQQACLREAAGALHPQARAAVLAVKAFQARLPHGWGGQYTAFGEIALKAGCDQPDPDLIRHEWAHYWWSHHLTRRQRKGFMQAAEALALGPDMPERMQPAQEIARAYLQGRDARCRDGNRVLVIRLHSNDGYRLAYCFDLLDFEVYAYIAQLAGGEMGRLPSELRPFHEGFFPP